MHLQAGKPSYRGRFAPTPSGPLHLGSLMTALAGWLEARASNGAWLVRIDDLHAPRCPKGMDAVILGQLERHALTWDEPVRYQSRHIEEYRTVLAPLVDKGLAYACRCTRATLARACRTGPDGPVYDGACRESHWPPEGLALRLRVGGEPLCIEDLWLGRQCRDPAEEIGDFIVQRADGRPAYQLASVVDEQAQRITDVVRGRDLLGSTFRQRCLQRILGIAPPQYGHLPLLLDEHGRKLSKQNHAAPLDDARAAANLVAALRLLGQSPPAALQRAAPAEVLVWARAHWRAANVFANAQAGGSVAYNAVQQSTELVP